MIVASVLVIAGLLAPQHALTVDEPKPQNCKTPSPTSTEGEANAGRDGYGVALEKSTSGCSGAPTGGGSVTSTTEPGTWRTEPACGLEGEALCHTPVDCPHGGHLELFFFTPENGAEEIRYTDCVGDEATIERQPITAGMVLRALRRVELPKPEMIVQPPKGKTLVNFDTIFHTEAETLNRTVRLLGQRVQLRIRPTGFTWIHGDGTTQYSRWPGMAFARGVDMDRYISHRYSEAYVTVHPNVEVSYSADFRVGDGAWRTVPGTVEMTGDPVDLRILEGRLTLLG